MDKVNVLVDLSEVMHRIAHTGGSDFFESRLFRYLHNLKEMFQEDVTDQAELNFILVADSRPYWRCKIYEGYKSSRDYPNSMQFPNAIRELSKEFKVLQYPEMEADDLMYLFCYMNAGTIICTSDADSNQTIYNTYAIRYELNNKRYTSEVPLSSFVYQWLVGCTKDDAPRGIPRGIGPVTLDKACSDIQTEDPEELYWHLANKLGDNPESLLLTKELTCYDINTYLKYVDMNEIVKTIEKLY